MSQMATRFSPASTSSETLFMPMPPNPTTAKLSVSEGARRSGGGARTCRGMIMAPKAILAECETKSRRVLMAAAGEGWGVASLTIRADECNCDRVWYSRNTDNAGHTGDHGYHLVEARTQ